jgi:diaminohydroxyphosphoribosylaminopyrimidine deaminase / 5-amino-6-(5-phosphoribosylamino)uracil reductase
MVGVGTALSDDPQLNVRLPGIEECSPVRVILDSRLRLPLSSKLVRAARKIPLWVVTAHDAPAPNEERLRSAGAEILRLKRIDVGPLDLNAVMRLLSERGVTRVFSEGGPSVADDLIVQGLADTVIISTADHALGQPGLVALRPALAASLRDETRFVLRETKRYGTDVFKTFERLT